MRDVWRINKRDESYVRVDRLVLKGSQGYKKDIPVCCQGHVTRPKCHMTRE